MSGTRRLLRIGTRASKLAMVQAETVAAAVRAHDPAIDAELVPMTTTGDKILDRPLDKVGGKGLFVKELDAALADGRVDIVVHSSKDLPMDIDPALPVVAASSRGDARDALVLSKGADSWDRQAVVGCSSARRRVQLELLYPGIQVSSVRGNVQTRLGKLDDGQFGALVLAAAGLARLGLAGRASRLFDVDEMIPAAGQGILAVTARAGEDVGFLDGFASPEGMSCLRVERAFVRALDGGCSKPCAAFARREGGRMTMRGMYVNDDETVVLRDKIALEGEDVAGWEDQAMRFAEEMRDHG